MVKAKYIQPSRPLISREAKNQARREAFQIAITSKPSNVVPRSLADIANRVLANSEISLDDQRHLVGTIKPLTCVSDVDYRKPRTDYREGLKNAEHALKAVVESILVSVETDDPVFPRMLKNVITSTRKLVEAERDAGEISEEEIAVLRARAQVLMNTHGEAQRRGAIGGGRKGTIYSPPPKHEKQPDLTGATVRALCFHTFWGPICPLDGSIQWCRAILDGCSMSWVEIPLVDYNNPNNWRSPCRLPQGVENPVSGFFA